MRSNEKIRELKKNKKIQYFRNNQFFNYFRIIQCYVPEVSYCITLKLLTVRTIQMLPELTVPNSNTWMH